MPLWGECGLTRGKTLQRKKAHGRKNLTMQSIQMGFSVLLSTKTFAGCISSKRILSEISAIASKARAKVAYIEVRSFITIVPALRLFPNLLGTLGRFQHFYLL